jgi:hypothetical protein
MCGANNDPAHLCTLVLPTTYVPNSTNSTLTFGGQTITAPAASGTINVYDTNGGSTTSVGSCPTARTAYATCSVIAPSFARSRDTTYAASCAVARASAQPLGFFGDHKMRFLFMLLAVFGFSSISREQTEAPSLYSVNGIEYVDCAHYSCSPDLGAGITAAMSALPSTGGQVIWPQGNYTISSTITVPAFVLLVPGVGKYTDSQSIIFSGKGSGMRGQGCGQSDFNTPTTCQSIIQEAAAANLTQLVNITAPNVSISDVQFDGNKANERDGGIGINCQALRCTMNHAVTSNFLTNGKQITSAGISNQAAAAKLFHADTYGNGNDGLLCIGSQDC